MIDTVVFDIGNVLTVFNWDGFLSHYVSDVKIAERITQATVQSPIWNELDRGVWTYDEVIDEFVKNAPEQEALLRTMFQNVRGIVLHAAYAIPWIQELRSRGYHVYVLSNFPEYGHRDCLEALDFLDYVDGGILSYQDKVIKPDPAIYQLLMNRYQLNPEHCVFIDDLERNLIPARKIGMQTIQFKSYEQAYAELNLMLESYPVRPLTNPITRTVTVPGSKSMTNRALFMAAMARGKSVLSGILLSDDSKIFLEGLKSLGFSVELETEEHRVTIGGQGGKIPASSPRKIQVGSAGTAARFLTAFAALNPGETVIECSEQMEKRPMKPLLDALTELGADICCLKKEGYLPVRVQGRTRQYGQNIIHLDIHESTQFLSALLMCGPLLADGIHIHIESEKKTGSYIQITMKMMEEFGAGVDFNGEEYHVSGEDQYQAGRYQIEPDLSAACYFYAAAALTGSSIQVRNVHFDTMQGDIKFLNILKTIGCTVTEEADGIRVIGRKDRKYQAVDVDMNDYSDQTMTLAAMAPFMTGTTHIRNVGHIRGQESDRMKAIVTELGRMGIACREEGDDIIITSGDPKPALIETYDDHRMAMAFALTGLRAEGITIHHPECCAKTFENYFSVLDSLLMQQEGAL